MLMFGLCFTLYFLKFSDSTGFCQTINSYFKELFFTFETNKYKLIQSFSFYESLRKPAEESPQKYLVLTI